MPNKTITFGVDLIPSTASSTTYNLGHDDAVWNIPGYSPSSHTHQLYVDLSTASTTATISGNSTTSLAIGINGVLPLENGGTGVEAKSAFEALEGLGGLTIDSIGTEIPNGYDIDSTTYRIPGVYYTSSSANAATLLGNGPHKGSGYKLITEKGYSGNVRHQFATGSTLPIEYRYAYNNNGWSWSNWHRLVLLPSSTTIVNNAPEGQTFADYTSYGNGSTPVYINANGTVEVCNPFYGLTGGTSITANWDLNSLTAVGNYRCSNNNTANTINNTPYSTSKNGNSFTLKLSASLGSGTTYLRQEWISYKDGVDAERVSQNSGASWGTWRTKVFKNSDAITDLGSETKPVYISATGEAKECSSSLISSTTSTDNAIVRFDGTTGLAILDSKVTIDDNGCLSVNNNLTAKTITISSIDNENHILFSRSPDSTTKPYNYISIPDLSELRFIGGVSRDIKYSAIIINPVLASGTNGIGAGTQIIPGRNNIASLGNVDYRWKEIYAHSSIYVGSTSYVGYGTTGVPGVYIAPLRVIVTSVTTNTGYGYLLMDNLATAVMRMYTSVHGTASTPETSEGAGDGTLGVQGEVILLLGNTIPRGELGSTTGAGNARGRVRLCSTSSTYCDLYTQVLASNRAIYLPNADTTAYLVPSYDLSSDQDLNDRYNAGIYCIEGGKVTNNPPGSSKSANLLVLPYRKPFGNSKPNWGSQIFLHTSSDNATDKSNKRLWYRGSTETEWLPWVEVAHIDANTSVGDANTPVYVASDGTVTAGNAIVQDGISGANVNRYGACETASNTAAKTVSITNGTIPTLDSNAAGLRITVKFNNANTANSPTLNVNSKGAKNIYYLGTQITTGINKTLLAGVCDFVFDGTQWHLVGNGTSNIIYSNFTINSGRSGVTLTHASFYTGSYVLLIVITSGENNLYGPITWESGAGYITLSTDAVTGNVSGYILVAYGQSVTPTAADI